MSYWGPGADENDFAFDSVGACIYLIKEQMLKDISAAQDNIHPEQSILSMLVCLRLIGERFPKSLSVHFRKKHFQKAKESFYSWYEASGDKIPVQYRSNLLKNAEDEFRLFEEHILSSNK